MLVSQHFEEDPSMTTEPNGTVEPTALDERIRRSWDELLAIVGGLDDRHLTALGPDGWSIKDHLVHVARWEEYLLASLEGRDPLAALGLEGSPARDADAINAALHPRDADRTPAEVRRLLADTHAAVVARVGALDAAGRERSLRLIEGNTWDHFDEHRAWIAALVRARA
jgi:hypothetical protein